MYFKVSGRYNPTTNQPGWYYRLVERSMTAYMKMQFTNMQKKEKVALIQGLLRYCELDTLAMVVIFEAWRE